MPQALDLPGNCPGELVKPLREIFADRALLKHNVLAAILCAFAFSAMLGDLLGSKVLKGLGMASAAAPCPKVFCQVKGWEPFACEYELEVTTPDGQSQKLQLTPEIYQKLRGPYNRKNVYGAALSFAPVLPVDLQQAVFHYSLAPDGPLRSELGIRRDATNITIRITAREGSTNNW